MPSLLSSDPVNDGIAVMDKFLLPFLNSNRFFVHILIAYVVWPKKGNFIKHNAQYVVSFFHALSFSLSIPHLHSRERENREAKVSRGRRRWALCGIERRWRRGCWDRGIVKRPRGHIRVGPGPGEALGYPLPPPLDPRILHPPLTRDGEKGERPA